MNKFSSDTKIVDKIGEFKITKRFNDKTGFVNGYLTVTELAGRNKHSQAIWKCICNACGRDDVYVTSGDLKRNLSCGCARNNTNKLSTHPHHQKNNKSPYWKGYGEISMHRFSKIKDAALKRKLHFDVSIEQIWELFLKQNKTCALSGLPIEFGLQGTQCGTASLDRIDSSKGYVLDNVQWVHKHINTMKWALEESYFIELCKKVVDNHRRKND